MFTMRFRDPFGCHGVSCVKLPAAVAFPTDERLLQRLEASRRALPANNMKPLWKSREPASSLAPSAPRERDVETTPTIKVALGALELLPMRDPHTCVVPLARAAGSLARGHDRLPRALHGSVVAS
jgi:hypothetical protein